MSVSHSFYSIQFISPIISSWPLRNFRHKKVDPSIFPINFISTTTYVQALDGTSKLLLNGSHFVLLVFLSLSLHHGHPITPVLFLHNLRAKKSILQFCSIRIIIISLTILTGEVSFNLGRFLIPDPGSSYNFTTSLQSVKGLSQFPFSYSYKWRLYHFFLLPLSHVHFICLC